MTTEHPIEAQAAAAIGGIARSAPTRQTPGNAVPDAIMFADDRLDRLGHALDELDRIVVGLTEKAAPVMTNGEPTPLPQDTSTAPSPGSPEDTRSEVARRISGLGIRADRSADLVQYAIRRIAAVLDALEV